MKFNTKNGVIAVVIAAAAFAAIRFGGPMGSLAAANDSPAEVVGGSIKVVAYDSSSPFPYGSFCQQKVHPLIFCVSTHDSTMISFDNVPGTKALVLKQGWKLHLTNRGGDGSEPEALVVCSASDCSLQPGDGQTIYIRPGNNTRWVFPNGAHEPHFHDLGHTSGGPPDQEDPNVDRIEHIWIEAAGQDANARFPCPDNGKGKHVCTIYIGPRSMRQAITNLIHHVGR